VATDNEFDFRMISQLIEQGIDFGTGDAEDHLDASIDERLNDDSSWLGLCDFRHGDDERNQIFGEN
jgi:hypothetical protein